MRILLTNDDGISSSALLPTIKELEIIGNVTTVVPRYEQSWTSKTNTRRPGEVDFECHEIEGRTVYTLDAYPADCANFGIYNFDHTPDLVVSGANLGHNIGISAFFSSGTIGGALEGLFAGIPSIAISVPYPHGANLNATPFAHAINGIWDFCERFYRYGPENALLANVNLPYDLLKKELHATEMCSYHYGSLFVRDNDQIRPALYSELQYPSKSTIKEGSDVWARDNNLGSVIMLDKTANFISPAIVSNWLEHQQLSTIGDEDEG